MARKRRNVRARTSPSAPAARRRPTSLAARPLPALPTLDERPATPETTRTTRTTRGGEVEGEQRFSSASLLGLAAALEAFFLALVAVAPVGGVSQSVSPLARAWPALLAPARALFGDALVNGSVPPDREWPSLALFATLLAGASLVACQALASLGAPSPPQRKGRGRGARTAHPLALLLVTTALFGVTLALLPSLPSDDIFSYILYGRIGALHHANPLTTAPSAFPDDPFLTLVFWRGTRSVYGPVWLLLSGGLALLAQALGGSLAVYVALFKLLGLLAHLANVALIWAILGRVAPRRRLFGALLYAWNPLCLLEFCASAHNDAVMLTFALLGVYLLTVEREAPALVAFALSVATKYVWLALLPFYLALVVRRLLTRQTPPRGIALALVWRLALLAGVILLAALPYWAGPQTLGAILYSPPAQQLDNSPLEVAQWPLRALAQALGFSAAQAKSGVEAALKALGLLGFGALWLWQFRRARSLDGMLTAWGWALLWYTLVASGWYWPWYATWAVALVALLPWGELSLAALLLAGGSLTLYAFLPLYSAPVYGLRALVAFGPAAAYLLWRRFSPGSGSLRLGRRR